VATRVIETPGPRTATIGSPSWVAALVALRPGWPGAMLLLGALVVVPLGLGIVDPPKARGRHARPWWAAERLRLPAALALVAAFALPAGAPAALLILPWLVVGLLVAFDGLVRFVRGPRTVAEVSLDAGLIYLAVGAAWAVVARAGLRPLGFPDVIVVMTAVHFHYAGFALPLLAGLAARELGGPIAGAAALGVVAGVPLVAAGIIDAQVASGLFPPHRLELAASWLLAASAVLVGLAQLRLALRPGRPVAARALLAVSGLAPLGPMALAGLYTLGACLHVAWVDIDAMFRYHGAVNALAFILPGLLAWGMLPSATARRPARRLDRSRRAIPGDLAM
jgi:hypothetical protein